MGPSTGGSLAVTIPDCKTGSVTKIVCISRGGREGREGRVNQCFNR